jgi:hypothetical protein
VNAEWRVLDTAHKKRNLTEYEGSTDIDEALVDAIIRVAREVEKRVVALGPVATNGEQVARRPVSAHRRDP